MYRVFSLVTVFFLVMTACTTMRTGSDYYSGADFSEYGRFAWISDSPLIRSDSAEVEISPLNIRRIQDAIEREMTSKGFGKVDQPGAADFAISFTVGARDVIEISDYPTAYRGSWRWRGSYYGVEASTYRYTEGVLAIDVFDQETGQPVWHGWARKRITTADVEGAEEAVQVAVEAILEAFPPAAS